MTYECPGNIPVLHEQEEGLEQFSSCYIDDIEVQYIARTGGSTLGKCG